MRSIIDEARNKWRNILPQLGISPDFLVNKKGPCPMCGGKDRFRFDDLEGNGTWICNNCRSGTGINLVMMAHKCEFKDAASKVRAIVGTVPESPPGKPKIDPVKAREGMLEIWKAGVPIEGTEAERYLRGRGFLPPWSKMLRCIPKCRVRGHPTKTELAAMIAKVDGYDGHGVNIHRTYLEDGEKAQMDSPRKMMPGSLPEKSAIRLWPVAPIMGVAEGIETALAVTRDFKMPCWSLINTSNMVRFGLPEGVKELHVFGDHDAKYGGQAAAYILAHKIACYDKAPMVRVRIPPIEGTDWADR